MMELEIDAALAARARAGEWLTDAELRALDATDVLSLGMLADEVRRARVGDAVRYTRVLSLASMPDWQAVEAALPACHEVRLTTPGATLQETADLVAGVRRHLGPSRRLTGFSLAALEAGRWAPLREVAGILRQAGLDGLAEAPVDLVTPAQIAAVHDAGLPVMTLSVARAGDDRVALLLAVRALLEAGPAIDAFDPLPRQQSVAVPTTGYHDLRMVALARLALPGLPTLGIDWQQYGPKLAQVALTFGANHLDGVSPWDDASLGHRRSSVEEVRRNIEAAGFRPVEAGGPA